MNNELMRIILCIHAVTKANRNINILSSMCDTIHQNKGCDDIHCSICLFGYSDNKYTPQLIHSWKRL